MRTLQWWPRPPNGRLQIGDRLLVAGETFTVSEEDAEELLTSPATADEVREAPKGKKPKREGVSAGKEADEVGIQPLSSGEGDSKKNA